jgi:hypothetical protein
VARWKKIRLSQYSACEMNSRCWHPPSRRSRGVKKGVNAANHFCLHLTKSWVASESASSCQPLWIGTFQECVVRLLKADAFLPACGSPASCAGQADACGEGKVRAHADEHQSPVGIVHVEVELIDRASIVLEMRARVVITADRDQNACRFARLQDHADMVRFGFAPIRHDEFVAAFFFPSIGDGARLIFSNGSSTNTETGRRSNVAPIRIPGRQRVQSLACQLSVLSRFAGSHSDPASSTSEALFTHVDIAPILLSMCGLAVPPTMHGAYRSPILLGSAGAKGPDLAFLQIFGRYRGDVGSEKILRPLDEQLSETMRRADGAWGYDWTYPVEDDGRSSKNRASYTAGEYLRDTAGGNSNSFCRRRGGRV